MRNSWRGVLVGPESTIATATEVLTNSSMRIVLVADNVGRLLGTVTDGDIRRALMRNVPMDVTVDKIMQTNPVTAHSGEDKRAIIQLMRRKDLLQVPILDREQKLVGLETMQDLLIGEQRENPVLLMAGGFGKRLYPRTKELPKPLLAIGNKPILESIVEQLADAGFVRFFLSVHYKADLVQAHFGDGSAWGVSISYLEERKPLGTGGALGLIPKEALDSPILMVNGDLLTKLDFGALLRFHEIHEGVATICVRKYKVEIPYGVVELNESRLVSIFEKPIKQSFVNAGIYVLNPRAVKEIERDRRLDMPDFLRQCISRGEEVNAFPIHEYWIDIGRESDYQQALTDSLD